MPIDFSLAFAIAFVSVLVAVGIFIFMQRRVPAAPRARTDESRPPLVVGDADWVSLSEREKQVARRVAAGESNKEVAQALGISPQTVGAHLKSIYQKMNVQSRMQLAARLHEIER